MFNENTLKAMRGALFIRLQSMGGIEKQNTEAAIILYEGTRNALALVDAMLRGDTIASLWSIEDVQSLSDACDVNDGYCDTHNEETKHADYCVDGDPNTQPIDDETARAVLKLADHDHDAEQGINWDTLRYQLEIVQRGDA